MSGTSSVTWEYNDIYYVNGSFYNGVSPGDGCIFVDPDFEDPTGQPPDFHLVPGSPCVNTGDPNPMYNDYDGSQNDMGCYGGPSGDWEAGGSN